MSEAFISNGAVVKSALDSFFRRVRGAASNIVSRNKDSSKLDESLKQLQLAAEKEFLAQLPKTAHREVTQLRVRNVVWDMIDSEYQSANP